MPSGDAPSDGGRPKFCGIDMKWVSLIMLVMQTVGVVFLMRVSRTSTEGGPKYVNTTAVFFSEVLKLVSSCILLSVEMGSPCSAFAAVKAQLLTDPSETLKTSVPSVLYTLQNNLQFIALSHLSGAVYQVTYQLKILTTSLLSVYILGKVLDSTKWCSLVMLTVGVIFLQWPRESSAPESSVGDVVLGVAAVMAACVTSGFAGVFLEKLMKQAQMSIWLRNIQMALFGTVLSFAGCIVSDGAVLMEGGFLQGYTPVVWGAIAFHAIGGLVVAAVLKYADNILKCFGNAVSIVMTCMVSTAVGEFQPDLPFLIGTKIVLVATALYSLGLPEGVQMKLGMTSPVHPVRASGTVAAAKTGYEKLANAVDLGTEMIPKEVPKRPSIPDLEVHRRSQSGL